VGARGELSNRGELKIVMGNSTSMGNSKQQWGNSKKESFSETPGGV